MEGAKPPSAPSAEGEISDDRKRSGRGEKTSRWDVFSWGNPIKGFPCKAQPCKAHFLKKKPRQRESEQRFDSLARFLFGGKAVQDFVLRGTP